MFVEKLYARFISDTQLVIDSEDISRVCGWCPKTFKLDERTILTGVMIGWQTSGRLSWDALLKEC